MENPIQTCIDEAKRIAYHNPKNRDIAALILFMERVNKKTFGVIRRPYKFVLKKSIDKQFYGLLVAPNGQPMDQTEMMKQRGSVVKNFHRRRSAYVTAQFIDQSR